MKRSADLGTTLLIARWEFGRFFKWKDQLISLVVSIVVGLGFWGIMHLMTRPEAPATVAVTGEAVAEVLAREGAPVSFVDGSSRDESAWREALADGDVDGVLRFDGEGGDLLLFRESAWRATLEAWLTEWRSERRMEASALTRSDVAAIFEPVVLTVTFDEAGRLPSGKGEKVTAGILVGLMVVAIYYGLAYFFTGITGEKQLRVTEQVVSAVSPQSWIDGKLIGITLLAFVGTLVAGVSVLIFIFARAIVRGDMPALPSLDPSTVLLFATLTVLGVLFWNGFFGVVAATISDPQTSQRSSLMMLPFLPVALAFATLSRPDGTLVKFLSLLPGTSSAVLPARWLLGDVAAWELIVAFTLLFGGILVLRRAAGRVFENAMLMYGQEPSLREITRWVKR